MKFRLDKKYLYWGLTAFVVAVAVMLFYFGIFHMQSVTSLLGKIYSVITPLVYGAVIAYVLNPLVRFLEKQVLFPLAEKAQFKTSVRLKKSVRMASVLISLVLFFMIIYGLLAMLIPELLSSITNIVESFPRYINRIQQLISDLFQDNPDLESYAMGLFNNVFSKAETWLNSDLLPKLNELFINFSIGIFDVLIFLKNFLIGAMISIYMLYGKENYIAHGKQLLYAIRSNPEDANNTINDLRFIDKTFGGFIIGKIIDSLIIGLLCYIGLSILNLPYTLLISVVVGVTNVIPFFGPFIGAIPSAFLILLINPLQCLYFAIFILILQQFDGNFLGPKILGDSTGLSSFMVIVAIIVGGGFFGAFGMFVGVPFCAVLCTIIRNIIRRRLKKKGYPLNLDSYHEIDHLDSETKQPVYRREAVNPEHDESETFIFGLNRKKEKKTEEVRHETGHSARKRSSGKGRR